MGDDAGPEAGVSVTPEGGPKVGASVDKEGSKGFMQPKVAPYVYGPKTTVGKDGVHVKPGVTVETPSYPPDSPVGVYGTGTVSPNGAQVGAGVSAAIPKVGDASADVTVPVPPGQPIPWQPSDSEIYGGTLTTDQVYALYKADQADGGSRVQNYNDSHYGPAAPGKKHVDVCPYCPPWPNVPKNNKNSIPPPLERWEVHNGPEGE